MVIVTLRGIIALQADIEIQLIWVVKGLLRFDRVDTPDCDGRQAGPLHGPSSRTGIRGEIGKRRTTDGFTSW